MNAENRGNWKLETFGKFNCSYPPDTCTAVPQCVCVCVCIY